MTSSIILKLLFIYENKDIDFDIISDNDNASNRIKKKLKQLYI